MPALVGFFLNKNIKTVEINIYLLYNKYILSKIWEFYIMSMNVSSISGSMYGCYPDPEHQRIMRELRALGLEPTGDKTADKAKLEAAKAAMKSENNQQITPQAVDAGSEADKNQAFSAQDEAKASVEISALNMTGAEQVGQLNKLKLLGLF